MNEYALSLENVSKSFDGPSKDAPKLEILRSVSLELPHGGSLAIVGKSGSGKSTLLYIASLIEAPSSGRILYDGRDVTGLTGDERAVLRREKMGFVFQNSLLLDDFSALENVMLPLMNSGLAKKKAEVQAEELLARLRLGDRLTHRPFELSGGERQRVAIARALCTKPSVVFADEPTGALDEESQSLVEDLLLDTVRQEGSALLLVTHNLSFARRLDEVRTLSHKELSRGE